MLGAQCSVLDADALLPSHLYSPAPDTRPPSQTQTSNLSLRSSSALGSKQFASQADKLSHSSSVEEGRRGRARTIVSRIKGRGHLSDEGSDSGSEGEEGDVQMERELVDQEQQEVEVPEFVKRSTVTLNSQKPPPFNASGSLGVVEVLKSAAPSTSTSPAAPITRSLPPPPASVPATIGSGLKAGAVVHVVKRKPKEKGRMRAMAGMAARGKGKGRMVESEEEEDDESDFDSSDSAMDSESDDEEGGEASEEEWGGIKDDAEGSAKADEEDEEDDSSDDDDEDPSAPARPPREKGAFRAWADAQILSAAGHESTAPTADPTASSAAYAPLLPSGSGAPAAPLPGGLTGPLGASLTASQLPTLPPQRSTHIPIERTEEMQKQREKLPIVKEEDRIMEAIRGHAVVVICGETGSGKTTQVGQFLWEAGWGDKSSGESDVKRLCRVGRQCYSAGGRPWSR